jgi:hypothetical protein
MAGRAAPLVAASLLLVSLAGCSVTQSDPSPFDAPVQIETRLYFGLSRPGGGTVEPAQWERFVAEVVTPRFPDGLTVFDARGQYLSDQTDAVISEATKVLVVIHGGGAEAHERLDLIIREYKRRFEQESVLRTETPVSVAY